MWPNTIWWLSLKKGTLSSGTYWTVHEIQQRVNQNEWILCSRLLCLDGVFCRVPWMLINCWGLGHLPREHDRYRQLCRFHFDSEMMLQLTSMKKLAKYGSVLILAHRLQRNSISSFSLGVAKVSPQSLTILCGQNDGRHKVEWPKQQSVILWTHLHWFVNVDVWKQGLTDMWQELCVESKHQLFHARGTLQERRKQFKGCNEWEI